MEPNYEYSDAGYPVKEPVPYFAILLREPNKIRLINVGPELVSAIQERLEQLITVETFGYVIFKDYLQTRYCCLGFVYYVSFLTALSSKKRRFREFLKFR